ncbi:MAG: MFS transporter [Thermoleophilia bacterium]|nr:MFS transporter [Thermoleophilia bacterium]
MSFADALEFRVGTRRVLITLTAILFLTFLDTTILSVGLYDLQSTLHTSVSDLQWIVNAYALVFASFMLAFGTLGDRLGRKRVMLGGLVVFIAGSLFGALAPNIPCLIAARAIMGLGAAACEPGTLSIIRQVYPDQAERARALGLWAAVAGFALAMGPVIGGVLVGLGGWPAIFWFNLAAGILILAISVPSVPESADPETARFDFAGYVLGPVALGTVVFAIIVGESAGYTAPHVLTLFAVGIVAAIIFGFVELKAKAPMLRIDYLRRPPFSGSLLVGLATYFGVFSIFFLTALYLQIVVGYSAFRITALFVPMALGMIIASAFAGKWVATSGPRVPVGVGCFLAGAGVLLTDLALTGEVAYIPLVLAMTVSGIGFGIAVVPITSVALSAVPARHSGMAASATTTSREVGTVLGVAVLGSLFNSRLIEFLTQKLIELEIPPEYREYIINMVLTGQSSTSVEEAEALYGPIVGKVVGAAFDAVHNGVTFSLIVAGCVILFSGIVAWATFVRGEYPAHE